MQKESGLHRFFNVPDCCGHNYCGLIALMFTPIPFLPSQYEMLMLHQQSLQNSLCVGTCHWTNIFCILNRTTEAFPFSICACIISACWSKHLDTSSTSKSTLYTHAKNIHTSGLENMTKNWTIHDLFFLFWVFGYYIFKRKAYSNDSHSSANLQNIILVMSLKYTQVTQSIRK